MVDQGNDRNMTSPLPNISADAPVQDQPTIHFTREQPKENIFSKFNIKRIFPLAGFGVLVLGLAAATIVSQQKQENRQHAAGAIADQLEAQCSRYQTTLGGQKVCLTTLGTCLNSKPILSFYFKNLSNNPISASMQTYTTDNKPTNYINWNLNNISPGAYNSWDQSISANILEDGYLKLTNNSGSIQSDFTGVCGTPTPTPTPTSTPTGSTPATPTLPAVTETPQVTSPPLLTITITPQPVTGANSIADINRDGTVDILDWTILISCFDNKMTSSTCADPNADHHAGQYLNSDLNQDGKIDGTDINIFLRTIAVPK